MSHERYGASQKPKKMSSKEIWSFSRYAVNKSFSLYFSNLIHYLGLSFICFAPFILFLIINAFQDSHMARTLGDGYLPKIRL